MISVHRCIGFFIVLMPCFLTMEVHETNVELQMPKVNISWSPQGANFTYRLVIEKVKGITSGKNSSTVETKKDFTLVDLDYESQYKTTLLQRAPNSSDFNIKDSRNFKTSTQKNKLTDSSTVRILVLYNKKASYYQIIVRQLQPNESLKNLPATSTITDQYNNTQYIALNITQNEMNGTNKVFVIGTGGTENGIVNALFVKGKTYSTFQRTFFQDPNIVSVSHPWTASFTIKDTKTATSEDDEVIIISVSVLIGIIAFVIVIVFCCHWKYSRNYAPKPVKKKRTDPVQRQSTDPRIPVTENDFYDHVAQMKFHNLKGFYEEFSNMKVAFIQDEEFRNPRNINKNRFLNIPCFDHSRVQLNPRKDDNTYIHANFVPGYDTERDYILTQSPLPDTINDFWNMVWDYDVETVVMIGTTIEKGNNVCAPYFPVAKDVSVGALHNEVTLIHEHVTTDYIIRSLDVTTGSHSKRVKHFQYLSWPSRRVTPECPTVFLQFMKAVIKSIGTNKRGHPLVIHGTTGTGRSGIYASVDSQIRRIIKQGDLNVYDAVLDVREARHEGVKALDEYIFIHDAVLEWILKKNIQDIEVEYLPHYIENINKTSPTGLFFTEYNFLSATVVSDNQRTEVANQPVNEMKNRYKTVIPFDNNRVKLEKLLNSDGSDYINASYIDTYSQKRSFIATQAPLNGTIADFWRMIFENESWVIVMLGQEIEKGQLKADRFWPEEGHVMSLMNTSIKFISKQNDGLKDVVIRQLEISNHKTKEKKLVQLYQYLTWPSHEGITSESIHSLVQLVHQSKIWEERLKAKMITVVSSSGIGRPGVFIALRYLQEESESEGYVNIFQAVQKLRQQRGALIQSREEYILIYTSAMEITKHVRRKSIVSESPANIDISTIGLNIVPNSVTESESGAILERLNSVSQTSQF